MIRAILIVFGLFAVCFPVQSRVAETFRPGSWDVSAFVSDASGLFNSCVAIAKYRSGISMSVEVDKCYNWWIGFSANHWTMTTGEKVAP